jgi:hypothetical protein
MAGVVAPQQHRAFEIAAKAEGPRLLGRRKHDARQQCLIRGTQPSTRCHPLPIVA